MNRKLIACGRIGRAVGLNGFMAVDWFAGTPPVSRGDGLLIRGAIDEKPHEHAVAALRKQGRSFVIRFDGISDRTNAETMCGATLLISADRLPKLGAGQYYTHQIVGLDVVTEEGILLGKVERIINNGSHDIYEVVGAPGFKKEILIPAVEGIILSIDIENEKVIVRPLEGMV